MRRAASSACGAPCRIASSPSSGCAGSPRARPPMPSSRASSPTTIGASPGRRPIRHPPGAARPATSRWCWAVATPGPWRATIPSGLAPAGCSSRPAPAAARRRAAASSCASAWMAAWSPCPRAGSSSSSRHRAPSSCCDPAPTRRPSAGNAYAPPGALPRREAAISPLAEIAPRHRSRHSPSWPRPCAAHPANILGGAGSLLGNGRVNAPSPLQGDDIFTWQLGRHFHVAATGTPPMPGRAAPRCRPRAG